MRFRPLRPASAPDSALIAVADPPETMRAAVIDATGGVEVLHEASVPVPSPVLSELLVRVVAAGINPIDAKTRSGADTGRLARMVVTPGPAPRISSERVTSRSPFELLSSSPPRSSR